MTKTFTKIAGRRDIKSGELTIMPFSAMADESFVWIFEFWSLEFI